MGQTGASALKENIFVNGGRYEDVPDRSIVPGSEVRLSSV